MFPLDEIFEDEELRRLTREYPVATTLGRHYDFWKSGESTQDNFHGFFISSPAGDVIAERTFLGFLLQAAAQYDRWVGFKTGMEIDSVDGFIAALQRFRISDPHARALAKSLDAGMIRPEIDRKSVV